MQIVVISSRIAKNIPLVSLLQQGTTKCNRLQKGEFSQYKERMNDKSFGYLYLYFTPSVMEDDTTISDDLQAFDLQSRKCTKS